MKENTPGKKTHREIMPGDCFYLPEHSWALYNEDGTVDVGVETSFLGAVPAIEDISVPEENDLVEQGYPGFRLMTSGEVHGVFMPLSGRVVGVNEVVAKDPALLDNKTWVLKIIPSQLRAELESLKKRDKCH